MIVETGQALIPFATGSSALPQLQADEEVFQRAAAIVAERLVGDPQALHAVEAEGAKVVAQLAPRRHRPARAT